VGWNAVGISAAKISGILVVGAAVTFVWVGRTPKVTSISVCLKLPDLNALDAIKAAAAACANGHELNVHQIASVGNYSPVTCGSSQTAALSGS
jgi:hypothetical protein